MANGHYFDYDAPASSFIDIETMSHSLSNMCRFTGHCSVLYTVAQHSWLMSTIVPREDGLYALLHEAGEPVTGDINKPLKMRLPDLEVVENEDQRAILLQFGLDPDRRPASIKPADWCLLATEQRDFMPKRRVTRWDALGFAIEWEDLPPQQWALTAGVTPLPERIVAWPPEHANRMFLARFRELMLEALPHLGRPGAPTFDRPPRFDFSNAAKPVAGAADFAQLQASLGH
ncbi:MAG: metal-dependent phosphohydrolase [Roseateles sp.]|nr:MAG: metal-dependent phosphohydrolase [Roseateles sp.]